MFWSLRLQTNTTKANLYVYIYIYIFMDGNSSRLNYFLIPYSVSRNRYCLYVSGSLSSVCGLFMLWEALFGFVVIIDVYSMRVNYCRPTYSMYSVTGNRRYCQYVSGWVSSVKVRISYALGGIAWRRQEILFVSIANYTWQMTLHNALKSTWLAISAK